MRWRLPLVPPIWLVLHGHHIWWAALVLALAGGWWLERALRRRRSRRAWRARTSAFLRGSIDAGGAVRLTGTLRVEGEPARRFEDGAPVAIASAAAGPRADRDAACVSVRAERVWLDTSEGPIELRGRIDVVSGRGSRTASPPADIAWSRVSAALRDEPDWPFTALPVELRSIASGDRVEVAGTLERAVDAGDYRTAMRRVLTPSDAGLLVQLARPVAQRAWRGPLIALLSFAIANVVLFHPVEPWRHPVTFVSPITRPHARSFYERRVRAAVDRALTSGVSISSQYVQLMTALRPDLPCHERARLLRAADDAEAALRVAERCESVAGRRERTLALFALSREDDARDSWAVLLRSVDDACAHPTRCEPEHVELSDRTSFLDWGRDAPSQVPRNLFLGRHSIARPYLAHRLSALLGQIELRSVPMRAARLRWMLELAAFEVAVDRDARASALTAEVHEHLAAHELPPSMAGPLLRDTEHLEIVLALRGGGAARDEALSRGLHWDVPCVMRGLLAAARDPLGHGLAGALPESRDAYARVRGAFLTGLGFSGHVSPLSADSDRESLAWVEHFGVEKRRRQSQFWPYSRILDPFESLSHEHLLAELVPRSCGGEASLDAAAWDAALARAHGALGAYGTMRSIRACVDRARERLLALPPLERHR